MKYDYTGRPLNADEVLVLMPYDAMDVETNCKRRDNIVTVHVGGRSVKGVWKAVPSEWADEAKAQFNIWARDQYAAPIEGRCLIPQDDGTEKPCPRKNGNNRCCCAQCPHRGEYDREIIAPLSIDHMRDEYNYDPASGDLSPEDRFFATEEEFEGIDRANTFFERVKEISPKHALALKLMSLGIRGEQFYQEMGLSRGGANYVYHQIKDLAADSVSTFDQLDPTSLPACHSKRDDYYRRRIEEL